MTAESPPSDTWRFLTNHAQVLLCIWRDEDVRVRDIALLVGITERATQKIIAELTSTGYLCAERVGRRNRYSIHGHRSLGHVLEREMAVGALLQALGRGGADAQRPAPAGGRAVTSRRPFGGNGLCKQAAQ